MNHDAPFSLAKLVERCRTNALTSTTSTTPIEAVRVHSSIGTSVNISAVLNLILWDERLHKLDIVSHGRPIRRYWNCACTSGPRSTGVPEKIDR